MKCNILEEFNRTVIEVLHDKDWERAIQEDDDCVTVGWPSTLRLPIVTLSKVMMALSIKGNTLVKVLFSGNDNYALIFCDKGTCEAKWKLLNRDSYMEATAEDQTEKTLRKILTLFK